MNNSAQIGELSQKPRQREEYLALREKHCETLKSECSAYDKAILQLSAAAIAISIIFIEKISAKPVRSPVLVKLAWMAFIVSLTTIVFSFLVSQKKLRNEIEGLDREQQGAPPLPESKMVVHPRFLNLTSGMMLLVGFLFLAWFAANNLE